MADGYRLLLERLVHPRFCWWKVLVNLIDRWINA